MHSPYIFQFILNVLNNKSGFIPPASIEELRVEFLKDKEELVIEDLGAGSRIHSEKKRTVQQLARTAVKPRKYGELFFRLSSFYRPANIIELGTSLGITTAYWAAGNASGKVVTIEGSQAIHNKAVNGFSKLGFTNIEALQGNFDNLLPMVLQDLSHVDVAYIDGNHRYEPTMAYFHQLLEKSGNDTILIFDDIHWSREMEDAWEQIKQHPDVRCTVDIFFLGFVFFRNEFKERQHFKIRF